MAATNEGIDAAAVESEGGSGRVQITEQNSASVDDTLATNRNRSGSHRQRSGAEIIPDQAPNAPGLLVQAATIPDCVDWFDDDQYCDNSDVHHVRIDNVNPNQVTQIFQQILSQVNQHPRLHHRIGQVVVEPDEISPLPLYAASSAVLKKVLLIYVPAESTIVGFIICGLLPHPNNNRTPPEDHHDPPTILPNNTRQYTGFGSNGTASVTLTTSVCVKEELFHAIDTVDEDSITVRAIKNTSEIIQGLKCTKESLTQVIQGDGDTYRVFERNGSFFKLRQSLIFAVGGNLDRYCENYGGGARFIPFNDHLLLGEHRQSYDAMSNYLEESINIYRRDPLLRGNETYTQYQQQESALEIQESQFLADQSLRLIGSSGAKIFHGEVDRIAYAAAVSSRLLLDIGEDGGICALTVTVRNSTTQYGLWYDLQLGNLAHDICHPDHDDPDNAPPPDIVSSVERWNDLANRGVGLFNRLGVPYQEDNPEHQAFGLYCAALLIVRKMNDKYNNNAPCCFASIEPNSTGNGSHVQVLFTFHKTNGTRPEGFITYLNNATWSAGVQPKATATREKMAQVTTPASRGQIKCIFDYTEVCYLLLYMMKDDRSHNVSLIPRDQRSHHSQLKIGIQSGGLMISYLPHLKANYKSYFSRVHHLGRPGRRMPHHFHSQHFPPNFPEGHFKEPRAQNSTDHNQGTRRIDLLVNNGRQNPLPSLQYSNGGTAMYQQQQLQQQGGQLNNGQQLHNGGQLGNGQLLQNGQQSQYVQINQGGQVHTMTRQQQQRQQYPQQRQDQLDADKVALGQKNHRLAKELSDLRVKHREETKVVSRLTMENMNLASRCRQAISEAADLKRKLSGYEKEVLLLRRQIEKQHGNGGVSRRNRSTSPKKEKRNSGSDGGVVSPVDEKQKKALASAAAAAVVSGSVTSSETKNSSEATDLDRIMAQELFKKNGGAAAATTAANAGNGSGGGASDGSSGNAAEKKEGSANAVTKKFQELNISTTTTATTTNNKSVGGSKVPSSSASSSNVTTSSKRSVIPATATSSTTESANNNSSNSNISSANTKIPISVTTSSATQKDDEFEAEIDMVDFFATSSKPTRGTSSSVAAAANSSSSNSSTLPPTSQHTRSHITHKLKKTETDDHMPEELVGTPGDLLSPSASSKKNVGDNLLSSLDAFEASFASAFPETSFSIKSEAPSSTQLHMSFDVPVFDPFFKSPDNKDRDGSLTSTSLQSSPKPKTSSSLSSSSSGVTGSGSNHHKDGMKSQLKDLFPDSALTTSPKRGLDLRFDSTFPDVDIGGVGGSSSNSKSGKGKSSLSADKLDSAFSRAHASAPPKASGGGGSSGGKSSSIRPASLDMSAEIEQLDALASATEKADGGDRKRSVRKVKTPLSYAEPSTKQKLRRGDVLFPKIDADRKMELEAKQSKSGGAAVASASGSSPTRS